MTWWMLQNDDVGIKRELISSTYCQKAVHQVRPTVGLNEQGSVWLISPVIILSRSMYTVI